MLGSAKEGATHCLENLHWLSSGFDTVEKGVSQTENEWEYSRRSGRYKNIKWERIFTNAEEKIDEHLL